MTNNTCIPCSGNAPDLAPEEIDALRETLHPDWAVSEDGKSISRLFEFKGFAKATYLANAAAFLSDKEGHHADIAFGWGYCRITYTSHEADKLSQNDFICAAKLDAMLS